MHFGVFFLRSTQPLIKQSVNNVIATLTTFGSMIELEVQFILALIPKRYPHKCVRGCLGLHCRRPRQMRFLVVGCMNMPSVIRVMQKKNVFVNLLSSMTSGQTNTKWKPSAESLISIDLNRFVGLHDFWGA